MTHQPDCDGSSPPIEQGIEQQGFYVCNFEADDTCPAFSYSVGLRETQNHPDFLTMGLSLEMNSYLVVAAAEAVKSGTEIEPNHEYEGFLNGFPIRFINILKEHMPNHFGFGFEYYRKKGDPTFDAMQIVWPDKLGKWPWDQDVAKNMPYCQKLLDRDPHFSFYAPTNLAAFCSRGIFEADKPILDAIHETNGDWQFLSDEPCTNENIMIVCLEEVVKKDPTINSLFYLPYGKQATRKSVGDDWTIEAFEDCD